MRECDVEDEGIFSERMQDHVEVVGEECGNVRNVEEESCVRGDCKTI